MRFLEKLLVNGSEFVDYLDQKTLCDDARLTVRELVVLYDLKRDEMEKFYPVGQGRKRLGDPKTREEQERLMIIGKRPIALYSLDQLPRSAQGLIMADYIDYCISKAGLIESKEDFFESEGFNDVYLTILRLEVTEELSNIQDKINQHNNVLFLENLNSGLRVNID